EFVISFRLTSVGDRGRLSPVRTGLFGLTKNAQTPFLRGEKEGPKCSVMRFDFSRRDHSQDISHGLGDFLGSFSERLSSRLRGVAGRTRTACQARIPRANRSLHDLGAENPSGKTEKRLSISCYRRIEQSGRDGSFR